MKQYKLKFNVDSYSQDAELPDHPNKELTYVLSGIGEPVQIENEDGDVVNADMSITITELQLAQLKEIQHYANSFIKNVELATGKDYYTDVSINKWLQSCEGSEDFDILVQNYDTTYNIRLDPRGAGSISFIVGVYETNETIEYGAELNTIEEITY
jgi:hypothetical protein